MPDSRSSTALRQLSGLGREPDPPDRAWAIVTSERNGRLSLPAAACATLGASPGVAVRVAGICQRDALVLCVHGDGRPMTIDRRGRAYLPVAMREQTALLVGAQSDDSVVVITPATVLDRLGDVLAGGHR